MGCGPCWSALFCSSFRRHPFSVFRSVPLCSRTKCLIVSHARRREGELATPPRARSGRVVMGGVHTHHPVTVGAGNASTIANDGPVSQLFRQDSRGVQRTLTGKKWCPVWKEELDNEFPVPFGPGFV
jgi:hypothetical protein